METSSEYHADTPEPRYTSRLGDDPWKLVDRRSAKGRRIRAIVLRLLADIPGRDEPLVIEHAIGIAQLMIRAAELRADPTSDPVPLIRLEGLIDRRVRRLAFARSKAATLPPPPSIPPLCELVARVRDQQAKQS